jgi:hypothetical protein
MYKTQSTKIDFIENLQTGRGSLSSGLNRITSGVNLQSKTSLPNRQSFDLLQNIQLHNRHTTKTNRVIHSAIQKPYIDTLADLKHSQKDVTPSSF